MNTQADLFDDAGLQTPEPRFVDLRSLGKLMSAMCTETQGTLIFEHGSVALTADAWFKLRHTLRLPEGGS